MLKAWVASALLVLACGTEPCDRPAEVHRWPSTELTKFGMSNRDAVVRIWHNCNRYVCRMFYATGSSDDELVQLCTDQWALEDWP